jgi:hypothetical protein
MSENRYDGELEEPGDPLEEQEEDEQEKPDEGEPWAKTSSGDAEEV